MKCQINLMQFAPKPKQAAFSSKSMLQAMGLFVIGALLFYLYLLYQVDQAEQQLGVIQEIYGGQSERLQKSALSREMALTKLKAEVQRDKRMIHALQGRGAFYTGGYSEYMRAFARQDEPGLWLTHFEIIGDGVKLTLHGEALKSELLSSYIERLRSEPVMRGHEFAALDIKQKKRGDVSYVSFTLDSTSETSVKAP